MSPQSPSLHSDLRWFQSLAIIALLIASFGNQWFLGFLVAADGHIDSIPHQFLIAAAQTASLLFGLLIWKHRFELRMSRFLFWLFPVLFALFMIFDSSIRFPDLFEIPVRASIYYGFWLVGLAAYVGVSYFRPRLRAQMALAGYSCLVCLVLTEMMIPVFHDVALMSRDSSFDVRSREEFIKEERLAGNDVVPAIHPYHFIAQQFASAKINGLDVVPLAGLPNRQTVFCNESGQYLVYQSDPLGFHNPADVYEVGRLDVAILGDSFAQGACVCSDENAVAKIREAYPQTLSFGSGGNGPLASLAALREYALPMKPKVVLWWFYEGNDLSDLEREIGYSPLANYLDSEHRVGLLESQETLEHAMEEVLDSYLNEIEVSWYNKVYNALTLTRVRSSFKESLVKSVSVTNHDEDSAENLLRLKQILKMAQEEVHDAGAELLFVYLPSQERYIENLSVERMNVLEERQRSVLQIVEDLRIGELDINRAFEQSADPLELFPFGQPGHYDEEGYQVLADQVLKKLDQSLVHRRITATE